MVKINQTPHIVGGSKTRPYVGNVDIYYEKKLKEVFFEADDNTESIIYNVASWNYFIALVQKARLASVRDTKVLETVRPSFPLTFETFVNTVQQKFGDEVLKQLDANMDEQSEQLENCRTLINLMNIRFLRRDELH